MSSADPATEDVTEAERDEQREALLARLTELLGEDLLESHLVPGHDLWIRVPVSAWREVHRVARIEAGLHFFEFLSAIDWMPSPFGKSEDASIDAEPAGEGAGSEPEPMTTGYAGGETRFQVFSRLLDVRTPGRTVIIKADVAGSAGEPGSIESIMGVYPGANWHEREVHEMFGIGVDGHPYLAPLYLPTGFEGHPLRKDFPLVARMVKPWPGIVDVEPMPDEDDDAADASEDATEEEQA